MKKNIYLLAAKMLDLASDEFSNHGCNDLEKKVSKLITEEILEELRGEEEWPQKASHVQDWVLMDYLADKFREFASEEEEEEE